MAAYAAHLVKVGSAVAAMAAGTLTLATWHGSHELEQKNKRLEEERTRLLAMVDEERKLREQTCKKLGQVRQSSHTDMVVLALAGVTMGVVTGMSMR